LIDIYIMCLRSDILLPAFDSIPWALVFPVSSLATVKIFSRRDSQSLVIWALMSLFLHIISNSRISYTHMKIKLSIESTIHMYICTSPMPDTHQQQQLMALESLKKIAASSKMFFSFYQMKLTLMELFLVAQFASFSIPLMRMLIFNAVIWNVYWWLLRLGWSKNSLCFFCWFRSLSRELFGIFAFIISYVFYSIT